MTTKKISVVSGVPANAKVYNGFANETCVAPAHGALWTLVELVQGNTHMGWEWQGGEVDALATYEEMRAD